MPLSIIPLDCSCGTVPSSSPDDSLGGGHGSNLGTAEHVASMLLATFALLLLLVCAILTGLTMAICSLDITRLHILSMSGDKKKRNQALVISQIKRHASWFLCSMIICSIACAESIPIIIEMLFGNGWLPIVISTIAIAIFAELLPQYLIPRNAITWGHHCWPLIWGCMWLTCVISWPLSYILDTICNPPTERGIYELEQLEILIKFHERAEKYGGSLGPDASRVMRGALHLDHQTLQAEYQPSYGKARAPLADVERGEVNGAGILVPWCSVRRININEEVTKELILRIRSWAYSRIPIVGDTEACDNGSEECCEGWNNQKLYGFLHIKNLVGLELPDHTSQSKRLFVKDLPLYPLPIVHEDMPLYDLLNIFQLGIARIAMIIPTPTKDPLVPLSALMKSKDALPRYRTPLWSVSTGLNPRNTVEMATIDAHVDWTTDFLDAAQNDLESLPHLTQSVIGIGCPKPIGIVTYEDILDALLQKTSLDEKDFFDRDHVMPSTKVMKGGDSNSVSSDHSVIRTKTAMPLCATKLHAAFERPGRRSYESDGILRRRNISGPDDGVDGANDHSRQDFDGINEHSTALRVYATDDRSSYTENSLGGFHDPSGNVELVNNLDPLSKDVDSKIMPMRPTLPPPDHLAVIDIESGHPAMHFTIPDISESVASASLHRLRRITPFSEQAPVSYKEQHSIPTSKTLARTGLHANRIVQDTPQTEKIRIREDSFHDDRTMLPSQRKLGDILSQSKGRIMSL